MGVVDVRHVGMRMPQGRVTVPVAVFARRHGVVHMVVMAIVVAVGVLVIQRLVLVLVGM